MLFDEHAFRQYAVVALAAGFVVVASQAFAPSTTGSIAFGIAILAVPSLAQADRSRGLAQRTVDGGSMSRRCRPTGRPFVRR